MNRGRRALHQGASFRRQGERLAPPVGRRGLPLEKAARLEALDDLPGGRAVEADGARQRRLVEPGTAVDRDERAVLRRREAVGGAFLDEDADRDLVRPAEQEARARIKLIQGNSARHSR